MPISAITIENFKGIKNPIKVDFKPITLLFGPNSSGKSTIVQALHYALEIFDRNNLDSDKTTKGGTAVDLGGFETLRIRQRREEPRSIWAVLKPWCTIANCLGRYDLKLKLI